MSKLIVEPKTARLFRDTETFGKMDPYVKVQVGSTIKKTKTHSDGGKTPSWTDALTLDITGTEDSVTLTVYDEDIGKDDFVGSGVLMLSGLLKTGSYKDWLSLQYKGKEAGELYVEVTLMAKKSKTASADPYAATYPAGTYYATPAPAPSYYAPPASTYYAPPAPAPSYYAAPTATPGYYATPAPAPSYYAAPTTTTGFATAPPAGYTYTTTPGVYAPAPAPTYPATTTYTYAAAPTYYPPGSY